MALELQHDLASAVVDSVLEDAFPDRDELALAPLTAALPEIRRALQASGAQITNKIIETSRTNSEEIESWISHSRKLREDVEASKKRGREILELHERSAGLKAAADDAVAHRRLLESEVNFNSALTETLRTIKSVSSTFDRVSAELGSGDLHTAVNSASEAEENMKALEAWDNTLVVHLLKKRREDVNRSIAESVEKGWERLVQINVTNASVAIARDVDQGVSGTKVAEALKRLGRFDEKIDQLHQRIVQVILPSLLPSTDTQFRSLEVLEEGIYSKLQFSDSGIEGTSEGLLNALRTLLSFLQTNLPDSIRKPLSSIFIPHLVDKMVQKWLLMFIPTELSRIGDFESLLEEVRGFQTYLAESGWSDKSDLSDWVQKAARNWLARKRTHTLNDVRTRIASGVSKEIILQKVVNTAEEESGAPERFDEAWNSNWDLDDERAKAGAKNTTEAKSGSLSKLESKDEEDVSGWGLDEDIDADAEELEGNEGEKEDDIDWDAWGDDGDATETNPLQLNNQPATPKAPAKAKAEAPEPMEKVMESYVGTEVPQEVFSIVKTIIKEAEELKTNEIYSTTPISRSSAGLLSIPAQVLATFRALAPIYYVGGPSMQMILYNDIALLLDLLKDVPDQIMATSAKPLESLCRRTFQTALSAQKTILLDLIDSTQGFAGCTQSPQRDICFGAISSMVSQAKEVEKDWKAVLPQSTFKNAFVLDLLESVAEQIVNNVEDMEDIGEEDSHIMSSLLQTIAFAFDHITGKGVQMKKMSALARILEATMAEILDMMTKGELDDFSEEEMKDLIRALFAESELRRHVLAEVERWASAKNY